MERIGIAAACRFFCLNSRKTATVGKDGHRCCYVPDAFPLPALGAPAMSRDHVVVLTITIIRPSLAFAAAATAAGTSPNLLSSGLTFFVVLAALVAMLFEIKRLADS